MSQLAPTFNQIRAKVLAVRRKVPEARAIGIQAEGRWSGARLRQDGIDTYRIEQCDSTLTARIALLDEEPGVTVTVLVTALQGQELGADVLVRLAGRKLYAIDSWQIVKELFQAQTVAPRLRPHGWIADRLLELAGNVTPPAAGGYLDAETVWPLLLGRMIGLEGARPDLSALLRWSSLAENVQRFRRLPEEIRQAINDWLVAQIGQPGAAVLRCAVSLEQPDALPVGLVLGVVHHPQTEGKLDRAAGRMERFLGDTTPDRVVVERWHAAANEVVRFLDSDSRAKPQLIHRADEILREVQADDFAHLSDVLPRGFDQRLARLGRLLGSAIEIGPAQSTNLEEARHAVRNHDQARRELPTLKRIEMALRLVRWLNVAASFPTCQVGIGKLGNLPPQSLREAARDYLDHGSFVDWARSVLRAGDSVRELSEGYARLVERVEARRQEQNRIFAELLRDQTAVAGQASDLVSIERVLDEVVAPLATLAPVLVILLDGMSSAVSRELLDDLARFDWVSLGPEGRPMRPGLAAIPCVTEASRASLFCGRLCTGTADNEAAGFAGHLGLRAHCRSASPPVLFHKIALQAAADASLAANVREAIASPQKRVVAVVINAVDDHLLKGEQLDVRWTRDEIKVLPSLLYEARSARRVVVVLSDHGHLLDHQTAQLAGEGGERWRVDDGHVREGELQVQGPRVLLAEGHRLIAPWSERVRYGAKKNGYHGGLTPQEMVIPITVLAAEDFRLPGWAEVPDPTPEWWEPISTVAALPAVPVVAAPSKPLERKPPKTLWDDMEVSPVPVTPETSVEPEAHSVWIANLLASPIFIEQKKLGGRAVPNDDVFGKLIASLEGAGGKLTAAALARKLELPPYRLRGLLAVVQRVLNLDGFGVLSRDEQSDTIELNRDLLLLQFDLLAEDRP